MWLSTNTNSELGQQMRLALQLPPSYLRRSYGVRRSVIVLFMRMAGSTGLMCMLFCLWGPCVLGCGGIQVSVHFPKMQFVRISNCVAPTHVIYGFSIDRIPFPSNKYYIETVTMLDSPDCNFYILFPLNCLTCTSKD